MSVLSASKRWADDELSRFYDAIDHGASTYAEMARAVGTRGEEQVKRLFLRTKDRINEALQTSGYALLGGDDETRAAFDAHRRAPDDPERVAEDVEKYRQAQVQPFVVYLYPDAGMDENLLELTVPGTATLGKLLRHLNRKYERGRKGRRVQLFPFAGTDWIDDAASEEPARDSLVTFGGLPVHDVLFRFDPGPLLPSPLEFDMTPASTGQRRRGAGPGGGAAGERAAERAAEGRVHGDRPFARGARAMSRSTVE